MPSTKDAAGQKAAGPYSLATLLNFVSNNTILILVLVLFSLSGFFLGSVWTENRMLKKGTVAGTQAQAQAQQPTAPTQVSVTQDMIKGLFDDKNITMGKSDAKLTFVEFSDPSCPYCHIAAGKNPSLNAQAGDRFKLVSDGGSYLAPVPEMKKLVDQGKASFVWVYSPGHGNGELATQALYCAQEKGKFWPVHDKLMSKEGYDLLNETVKNDKANSGKLAEFLKDAIKQSDMQKCLESGKYADRIATDTQTATKFGVAGTPGFFVNTQMYAGAYSFTDMKSAVDAALGG